MRLTLFLLFISSFCFAQKEEIIGEKPVLNPPCEGFRESTLFDGTPAIIRDCETGEDYSVATSLQELNTKTLALSLKNQNLTTFPAEIFRYPQLRVSGSRQMVFSRRLRKRDLCRNCGISSTITGSCRWNWCSRS